MSLDYLATLPMSGTCLALIGRNYWDTHGLFLLLHLFSLILRVTLCKLSVQSLLEKLRQVQILFYLLNSTLRVFPETKK